MTRDHLYPYGECGKQQGEKSQDALILVGKTYNIPAATASAPLETPTVKDNQYQDAEDRHHSARDKPPVLRGTASFPCDKARNGDNDDY